MKSKKSLFAFLSLAFLLSACNSSGASSVVQADNTLPSSQPNVTTGEPQPAPPSTSTRAYSVDALIFNGTGTAASDAQSLASIASSHGLTYRMADSNQVNAMTAEDFRQFGMIIWPGGYAKDNSDSLSPQARQLIHDAVALDGLSYLGFCAGAFITGTYGSWGLNLAPRSFGYYVLEDQGQDRTMVDITFPDGTQRNILYYGGPELGGFGRVLGRYPNGDAAMVQETVGKGMIVLSAVHPESPLAWKSGLNDTDGSDNDIAWTLMEASLKGTPLPAF